MKATLTQRGIVISLEKQEDTLGTWERQGGRMVPVVLGRHWLEWR